MSVSRPRLIDFSEKSLSRRLVLILNSAACFQHPGDLKFAEIEFWRERQLYYRNRPCSDLLIFTDLSFAFFARIYGFGGVDPKKSHTNKGIFFSFNVAFFLCNWSFVWSVPSAIRV